MAQRNGVPERRTHTMGGYCSLVNEMAQSYGIGMSLKMDELCVTIS